jgi:colanic acid biosynthesis glycosyl transferase WcaI
MQPATVETTSDEIVRTQPLADHEQKLSLNAEGQKPRVLFLSISFDPEPGAVMGLPLARKLHATGNYDVQVLTAIPWYPLGRRYPGYKLRAWQWENLAGIRVLRVPLYASHDSSFIRRALTYLSFTASAIAFGLPQIGRVDVVYYFDSLPSTGFVAFLLRIIRGAATVQHIGDLWPDTVLESGMLPTPLAGAVRAIVGRWCSFLYRRHSAISVASPGLKTILAERGVPPDKVAVVYTWAFEDKFFPSAPDPAAARQMDSNGRFTVLYAGNLGPLQAIDTVLEAAALLRDMPDVQFVLVGSGQAESRLRARASELRLENLRFLGPRPLDEMNSFNATADALLVHLKDIRLMRCTTPSKTQVAMACGRPILMGVAGDAAMAVEAAHAGVTFEPENPRAMADAVLELRNLSTERRRAMGNSGRKYYETRMSLDVGSERLATLIRNAAVTSRSRRRLSDAR